MRAALSITVDADRLTHQKRYADDFTLAAALQLFSKRIAETSKLIGNLEAKGWTVIALGAYEENQYEYEATKQFSSWEEAAEEAREAGGTNQRLHFGESPDSYEEGYLDEQETPQQRKENAAY